MTVFVDYSDVRESLALALESEGIEREVADKIIGTVNDGVGNNADAFEIPDDGEITGQLIVGVREMTDEEFERESFVPDNLRDGKPKAIELTNGDIIFPSADPEGNQAGELFGQKPDGTAFTF